MPNNAYVLSNRDRQVLKDLIKNWEQAQNGRRGINPNEQQQTKAIWARVRTGTRITALRTNVGGTLEPGEGECVLWRNAWEIVAGNAEPVLTKINSQGSTEGQETADEADDEVITVYNYTPYELFECSWVQVNLSRQGRWEIAIPPLPVYFAQAEANVGVGTVGAFGLGHLNYEEVFVGDVPSVQWMSGITVNALCHLNDVGLGEVVMVAQEPGGKFVVIEQAPKELDRVRFALDTDFNNTGQAQATVLDVISGTSVSPGDTITVFDVKKQFGDTRTDSVGIASRFIIGDGDGTPPGQVWQVETSDQVVNKIKGMVTTSLNGNDPAEVVLVTPTHSESYWPYVLEEDTNAEGFIEAVNLNMFTANAGAVYIERRLEASLTDDRANLVAPYAHTGGAPKWIVTEVEKPTARWCMCTYSAGTWTLAPLEGFWEGFSPAAHDVLDGSQVTSFLPTPCELEDDEKGIAFLNNRGSEVGPRYKLLATVSALYGTGKQVDLVADLLDDPLPGGTDIVYEDECDLKYRKVSKAIVFGNTTSGECLMEATNEIAPALNQDTLEVITSISKVVDPITGEITLELSKSSIKTCQELPLPDVDVSILTPVTSNLLTDISCVGNEVTQSYETIRHLGTTVSGSNTVDLSCIVHDIDWGDVYIDYNNVINWPDIYVDYYHILWPDGCEPCDPPPTEGCCTITYDSGSTEDRTSSEAWCTAKATEEGITSTSWVAGPCGEDPTGCCEDQPGGIPDSMMTESDCTAAGGTWAGAGVECSGGGCEGTIISNFQIGGAASTGGGCTATFVQSGTATVTGGVATINGTWSGNTNYMTPYSLAGTITMTHDGTNWNWTGTNPADGSVFSGSCAAPCATGCGGTGSATDGSICTGWMNVTFSFNAA